MRIFTHRYFIFFIHCILLIGYSKGQAPVLSFTELISTGLSSPLDMANAGDGSNRLFIVQQRGTVKILDNGNLLPTDFLNISSLIGTGGERGLLSLAFHPNYKTNRYFYLYYTNPAGEVTISRMQTKAGNPNEADAASLVELMTIPKPYANHNGGKLVFGPDGNLYFGTGDGGSGGDPNNFAQSGHSLLGKMIRINVDDFDTAPYYSIPADNPFVNDTTVRDEILSVGLRNPFRWSFDQLNNDFWVADVGQGLWEEVNRQPFSVAAKNYGWRCYEGNAGYNLTGCAANENYIKPVFVYPHNPSTGGYSVTGGYVYRGMKYPALYGYYICADFATGNAWLTAPSDTGYTTTLQRSAPTNIAAFGQAEDGELYAVGLNGKIYSISTNTVLPDVIGNFTATPYLGFNELNWTFLPASGVVAIQLQHSFDAVEFLPAGNSLPGSQRSSVHVIDGYTAVYYRLKCTLSNGQVIYSRIIKIGPGSTSVVKLYPTVVNNGLLKLETTKVVSRLIVFSMEGKKVYQQLFDNFLGNTTINLPALNNGIYIARLYVEGRPVNVKIFIGN